EGELGSERRGSPGAARGTIESEQPARMTADASSTDAAPRVAVVGSGAWGTTLALLVARAEPVTLLSHSAATAARLAETHQNERRLPGIELPSRVRVTADAGALADATDLVLV